MGNAQRSEMALFLKNLLFTAIVPGTVAVYAPCLIAWDRSAASGSWLVVSAALYLVGAAIYLWCVWDFATFGRGTPAPIDAPKKLVIRGLYKHTRNPMYVGVLCIILGWAALFQAIGLVLYFAGVCIAFHSFVVFYEEPQLQKTFGASYDQYRSQVGRWLPRLSRGPASRRMFLEYTVLAVPCS